MEHTNVAGVNSPPPRPTRPDSRDTGVSAISGDLASHLRVPLTLEESGLSRPFLHGLVLRFLYERGAMPGTELAAETRLLFTLLDPEIRRLQDRRLVQATGRHSGLRKYALYELTEEGRSRARESIERIPYVGPAPVSFDHYRRSVELLDVRRTKINRTQIESALSGLVFEDEFIDLLGPAVTSGTTLFLYGPSGNGKTATAHAVADMYGNGFYVPHAVEADGHVIALYDPLHHEPLESDGGQEESDGWTSEPPAFDPRYVAVHRPVVSVGGELTLDQLELQKDPVLGVLRAPPQMKANGGVFIVDDFGRQRVRARDLLNRWMVPLESRVDYLAAPSGRKLPVPFYCQLIFATNLHPSDLVEEAFLRRIRYKIFMGNPTREAYEEIYRRTSEERGIPYQESAVQYLFDEYYERQGIPVRACHPRDLVYHVDEISRYLGLDPGDPVNAKRLLKMAGRAYFLELDTFEEQSGLPAEERPVGTGGGDDGGPDA